MHTSKFKEIKEKLWKGFSKVVEWAYRQISKIDGTKHPKIKKTLLWLAKKAKLLCTKSKTLKANDPDLVHQLLNEASDIQDQIDELTELRPDLFDDDSDDDFF